MRPFLYDLLLMEPWAADKKSFKLVWRCHNGHLARVTRQSVNVKDDNDVKHVLCADLLHLFYGCGKLRKTSVGDHLMKAIWRVIVSSEVSHLQM